MVRSRAQEARTLGFTLIELLVVVAIIALLISILLPSLNGAREQAKTVKCMAGMGQIAKSVFYYAEDNAGKTIFIQGTAYTADYNNNAPYYQYQQILKLWPYLKDLKIYRCASARGDNSAKRYFNAAAPPWYFFVRKSNEDYQTTAYANGWWPEMDPMQIQTEDLPEAYTEYWFNDYTADQLNDPAHPGQKLPGLNGGNMSKIPFPAYAVLFGDAMLFDSKVYKAKALRHKNKSALAYLDAHVDVKPLEQYYDNDGKPAGNKTVKDRDPWGNRPFYIWGLTRTGMDALN